MKHACVNCHFWVKEHRPIHSGQAFTGVMLDRERQEARKGEFKTKDHYALCCSHGVWDEGRQFDKEKRFEEIVERDRGEECFFFPYVHGMAIPAANVLQERAQKNRELKAGLRRSTIGLWIAGIGLAVSAVFQVLNYFWPHKP